MKSHASLKVWIYPLLAGAYPALALIAVNSSQINPAEGLRAILFGILLAGMMYILARLIVHDWSKSAVMAVFWIMLFFAYGHVYGALEGWSIGGFILGRHLVFTPVFLVIFTIGSLLLARINPPNEQFHRMATLVVMLVVIFAAGQTGWTWWRMTRQSQSPQISAGAKPDSAQPDVYFIILDAFPRSDLLLSRYGYDNSAFQDELRDIGFQVSDCSFSNYGWTTLSLSSTLNMDYMINLDGLVQKGNEHLDYPHYTELIVHSRVRSLLADRGYQTVAFSTGYSFTNLSDADVYITQQSAINEAGIFSPGTNAFEELFIRTTALRVLTESFDAWFKRLIPDERSSYRKHYDLVVFQLDQLPKIPKYSSPKFVFAHISAPHAPYVFSAEGEFRYTSETDIGYPEEIQYLNQRMPAILKQIIQDSTTPPIIVLLGDHAWPMDVRTLNFYAIYLPGSEDPIPYKTSVNTFRYIFNLYFDGNYPLLEEFSYESPNERQLDLTPVPLSCPENNP